MKKNLIDSAIIIAFSLLVTLPFAGKAYHIDDTAFLYIAEQIKKDPLRPYSFVTGWGTGMIKGHELLDTPLVPYYIALVSMAFNQSEIALHLAFAIFPMLAGISFYYIVQRFSDQALPVTLLFLSAPVFIVNSHNLMLDIPMLALLLASLAFFIHGVDNDKHPMLMLGSILAGLAFLAKPNAIIIIPILIVYSYIYGKRYYAWYAAVPILFIGLFALHNYFFEDEILIKHYIPFLSSGKGLSLGAKYTAHFFYTLSAIGGATILPIFFWHPFAIRKHNSSLVFASMGIGLAATVALYFASSGFVSGRYSLLQLALFFAFSSSALFYLILVVGDNFVNAQRAIASRLEGRYDKDRFFLLCWLAASFAFVVIMSGWAARYITLLLAPMVIIYASLLQAYGHAKWIYTIVFLTLFASMAIAIADYNYADSYRDFASKATRYAVEGNDIWFSGSWGFQFYMEKQGYKMLLNDDDAIRKGDILIVARIPVPKPLSSGLRDRLEHIETITYRNGFPLRTQNPSAHAGFYTYGAGLLPYSISAAELEHFDVYDVKK